MRRLLFRITLTVLFTTAPPALAASSEQCSVHDRRTEEALLHRRTDLGGLVQKQRGAATWKKLVPPTAPLLVVNLWSRQCKPCLEELPKFRQLMQEHPGVPFLFVADPPLETSREEIERFWARPLVELASGATCFGQVPPRGGERSCLLSLPEAEPIRSEDARLIDSLGDKEGTTTSRPITLLIDGSGVVRQAFVGSVLGRFDQLGKAITRLRGLLATERSRSPATPPSAKRFSKTPAAAPVM